VLEEINASDPEAAALMMRKHVRDSRATWEEAGYDFDITPAEWEALRQRETRTR
jgi:hypothetical protein